MKKIFRHWKIIYLICCALYTGWMIHAGRNEFDRINGQNHRLKIELEPARIRQAAFEELLADCRKTLQQHTGYHQEICPDPAPDEVEARASLIAEQRERARQRGLVKLVLFYLGFVVIFLLAPMVLLYMIIVGVILLKKHIRFVS
jgi:Ca2+/Na+ antiporter